MKLIKGKDKKKSIKINKIKKKTKKKKKKLKYNLKQATKIVKSYHPKEFK